MEIAEFVRQLYASLNQWMDVVMQDATEEQFNWTPPGMANAISTTFLHMLNAEDLHIQTILQGKPRIWESSGWSEKIGLAAPPGQGRHWKEARAQALDLATVTKYQQAVRAATDIYLKDLTREKLAKDIAFPGGSRSVAHVLTGLIIHLANHAGEIAALKGIQGVTGLPF